MSATRSVIDLKPAEADSALLQRKTAWHPTALRWTGLSVFAILWLLPPLLIAGMLYRYAVDVPVWDDIGIGDSLHILLHNGINLERLIVQHNESRPIFPRLLFYLLYLPTRWDVRWQMACSFAVVFGTGLLLLRVCRKTIDHPLMALPAALLVNLLLFSPVQWANFLWGVQLIVFVPALALLIGMLCLSGPTRLSVGVPVSALAALIATYSNSNGMIVWVLAIPFFFVHPSRFRFRALACWTVLAAVFVGYYFHGYATPPGHPPASLAWHDLKGAWSFMLSFLGNGLRLGLDLDTDVSLGLAALSLWGLGVLACLVLGRSLRFWRAALPWIILGAYSIVSAALTTQGRFGFGPDAAVANRYCTFAIPLWLAVVPLWIVIFCHSIPRNTRLREASMLICAASGGALVVLVIQGCLFIRTELLAYHAQLLAGRSVAQFALVAPDDEAIQATLFPVPLYARNVIDYAEHTHIFHPGCIASNDISAIAAPTNGVLSGYFDSMIPQGGRLLLSGWACIPPDQLPADAVLLTTPDAAGVERVFAIVSDTRLPRPDVAVATKRPDLTQAGWFKTIDSHRLPPGATVSAWAFDTYNHRAYRLGGSQQIP